MIKPENRGFEGLLNSSDKNKFARPINTFGTKHGKDQILEAYWVCALPIFEEGGFLVGLMINGRSVLWL